MAAAGGPRLDTAYVSLQLGEGGLEGEEKNRSKTIWRVSKKILSSFSELEHFLCRNGSSFPDFKEVFFTCFS